MRIILFSTGFFDEHEGVVANASRSGLSFIAKDVSYQKYEVGQPLKIKIATKNLSLKAKIIYMLKQSDTTVKFGVSFVGNKTLQDYTNLLDK